VEKRARKGLGITGVRFGVGSGSNQMTSNKRPPINYKPQDL